MTNPTMPPPLTPSALPPICIDKECPHYGQPDDDGSCYRCGHDLVAAGARVKFRDDHPEYPGMTGTVDGDLTLPGGKPTVSVRLDSVPATATDIEPFDDEEDARGAALAAGYRDRMAAPFPDVTAHTDGDA